MRVDLGRFAVYVGPSTGGVDAALWEILHTDATVEALVGTAIYPGFVPQHASMPAIVYQRISAVRTLTFGGPLGYVDARYQVTAWDDSFGDCLTLADAIRLRLDGYRGTVGSIVIHGLSLENQSDVAEEPAESQQRLRWGCRMDFMLTYAETPGV